MADHDRLGDLLDRALDDVGPVGVEGLAGRLDARRVRRRRRRRANRLVPLGAAAVLLVVLVTVLVRNQPATQVSTDDGTDATDGSGAYGFEPGWHELDPGPLGNESVATPVWTGRELVVLATGATDPIPHPDGLAGAAYDPATRAWRRIAPMPLPAGTLESVWTGSELIVVRAATGSTERLPDAAAAWDASTDTWRLLPAPPPVVANGWIGTFWTGGEALFPSRLARFDVATSTWLALPPLPADSSGRFLGGWTGSELVMARTGGVGRTLTWTTGGDEWVRRSSPPPLLSVGATVSDGEIILARASSEGAGGVAYDADGDRWSDLPSIDPAIQRCATTIVEVAGTAAVNWCSTVAILAPDRWIDVGLPDRFDEPPSTAPGMPGTYLGILVGAGDVLFGYGDGGRSDGGSLDLFVPARDQVPGSSDDAEEPPAGGDRSSTAPAWRIARIGSATLDVPGGYTLLAITSNGDEITVELPVEPGWAPERPCTIRSIRDGDDPSTSIGALLARSSQPEVDHVNTQFGNPAGAFLIAGDLDEDEHVIVSVSADEIIDIACQRLLTSRELAQYLR